MKARESGMPKEELWKEFFSPENTLKKMGVNIRVNDVVDFGCGYGTFAIPAAKLVSGKVYAIDIEPEMTEITKRKAKENGLNNVETMLRDFMSNGSGLDDESVDYAMLFNILHVKEPKKLIREAYRILKNNGKLGIIHWNYDPSTPRGPPMDIRPKPEQCIEWAKSAGFELYQKHDLKPYHYGIIMRKTAQ
ncbi:MAG: class I SAM-dependent methyltransferase [Candidatus Diapherotrites archaeon]|nr:class I SAM-dependent methyltransferase [Candidatus Diapherotrites archaeon]